MARPTPRFDVLGIYMPEAKKSTGARIPRIKFGCIHLNFCVIIIQFDPYKITSARLRDSCHKSRNYNDLSQFGNSVFINLKSITRSWNTPIAATSSLTLL